MTNQRKPPLGPDAPDRPQRDWPPLARAEATDRLARLVLSPDRARRFVLDVELRGRPSHSWESQTDRCAVGSHPSNDLVLPDPTVSRFHCEICIGKDGVRVRDLQSQNRTIIDGVEIDQAYLRDGSIIRLGRTALRFRLQDESNALPLSPRERFGSLVGASPAMRSVFTMLERAAATDSTVLLEGETGTGKELAAASLVAESARRHRPYIIVDCGAIAPTLIESELFGHGKGAFTGATGSRAGAFEAADGGTILLDEVGELPADLQPKLLRALESRHVRRLGENTLLKVDVRVIAATNRDLRAEVNSNRFRADLYYRLAVVRVRLPPLRERPEDIPLLAERILSGLAESASAAQQVLAPEFVERLQRATWPGNVRELRNYLERCVVLQSVGPARETQWAFPSSAAQEKAELKAGDVDEIGIATPFFEARTNWERRYLNSLMTAHRGQVEQAALAAGMGRAHLYRLLARFRKAQEDLEGSAAPRPGCRAE